MSRTLWVVGLVSLLCVPIAQAADPVRKIVLIAGPKSHGPVGNGIHDYPWSVKLLKVMLDNSNVADRVAVEYHIDGWPKDDATLDDADAIMVISDGRDGDLYEEAPPLQSPERVARVQKQIDRGCGFLTFHFSTFAPDKYAPQVLDWSGAYFDWEENGQKKWYSAINTLETLVTLPHPQHPVCRGVAPFRMKEEFYFNLRFGEVTPLLSVPSLPGREGDGKFVAWARERANGGRGFGTTCGHFYDNWRNDAFRKFVLNAICWTAKAEVPAGGVVAKFYTHAEITAAIAGVNGTARAVADDKPIRVLLLAGNDAHKWHNWEKTTPVIRAQLEADPRIQVTVVHDPEAVFPTLAERCDVLVQNNYANWHDNTPLTAAARSGLMTFLEQGGGLCLVHFANGAWNFSLPMAGESDWPEYRKIVRRVWNHQGQGEGQSGHDAFGRFTVTPTRLPHAITRGLKPFDLDDELYFRQDGPEPIEPLLTARSKVTQRDEPLAWTYGYGKGKVFQTLLGHSEQTYAAFEPCEMLRRGVAWSAGRKVIEFDPQSTPPTVAAVNHALLKASGRATPSTPLALTPGRFGNALDARTGGLFVPATKEMRDTPVSVECWTKLEDKRGFNILVASEPKSSSTHWEMYSYAGSGVFSVYMPGRGGEFKTEVDIADGKWHHVGMVFEPRRLRLYVDGRQALDRELPEEAKPSTSGLIAIGRLVEGGLGCVGAMDDVRITRGATPFETLLTEAVQANDATLGLWPLDELTADRTSPDRSKGKRDATAIPPSPAVGLSEPQPRSPGFREYAPTPATPSSAKPDTASTAPAKPKKPNHWGKEIVGFDWTEKDSVDNRWQQTDIGPWLAYTVPLPEGPVRKGLAIKLNDVADLSTKTPGAPTPGPDATNGLAVALYDTQHMQLRGAWTGGFLQFDPARYGIIGMPKIDGDLQFSTREGPAWKVVDAAGTSAPAKVQYVGLRDRAGGPVLAYRVGETAVTERVTWERIGGETVFVRTLMLSAHPQPLELTLFDAVGADAASATTDNSLEWSVTQRDRRLHLSAAATDPLKRFVRTADDHVQLGLTIPPATGELTLAICYVAPLIANPWDWKLMEVVSPRFVNPDPGPAPTRWQEGLVTTGQVGEDQSGFALDTLTLPFDNPWKALLFTTGVGFFDGKPDIAVCTVHGDVWTVGGVDDSLKELRWRRFATGLYQPLGLTVVGTDVYVLGRDQITRLRDTDGNGEADEYECVNNLYETSAGGHDYVACLERDSKGSFYFVHATQGVMRAAADGQSVQTFATGLRNPNGLGLAEYQNRLWLTASPQEGEWTPGSAIYAIRKGDHYGYQGPLNKDENFTPCNTTKLGLSGVAVVAPTCWIPRGIDNSSGGQVWIGDASGWGALQNHWLHLSFGQCTAHLVVNRPGGLHPGGDGTVRLPLTFDSGVCRGRMRKEDGAMYVVGLRGWVTSATQDGCLQRIRPTGEKLDLPHRMWTYRNGIEIEFAVEPDVEMAENPGNYFVEQWNYRYSAAYGSPDFKVSNPLEEGHDEVRVKSATVLTKNTVFLEIENLRPVSQMTIRYALKRKTGEPMRNVLAATIDEVTRPPIDPARLNRRLSPGQLAPDIEARLRPGVVLRWMQEERTQAEPRRMAALDWDGQHAPATRLLPKEAMVLFDGYLKVPLAGEYQFRVASSAAVSLRINGEGVTLSKDNRSRPIALHAGYNPVRIFMQAGTTQQVRLFWSGTEFAEEPVPPTSLFFDSREPVLAESERVRQGRELYLDRMCHRCHGGPITETAPMDLRRTGPSLAGIGTRLNFDWVRRSLLEGQAVRGAHSRMPRLFEPDKPDEQEAALAIAEFLMSLPTDATVSKTEKVAPVEEAESFTRGAVLNEDLGCIACHRLTPVVDTDDFQRISLADVLAKYQPAGLMRYLRTPHAGHEWNRMPDFRLTEAETADLAAFLKEKTTERANIAPRQLGDIELGRRAVVDRGCIRCHEIPTVEHPSEPIEWQAVDRGCLLPGGERESKAGRIPDFGFTREQRQALLTLFQTDIAGQLDRDPPADSSRRLFASLRCGACHSRDGDVAPRGQLIAEESERGLPPESLPNLTWAGEKLHTDWMAGLLKGTHTERTRPWLKARMPAFPAYAHALAKGLAAEHGLAPTTAPKPSDGAASGDIELTHLGAKLIERDALDCRQCHALGNQPPTGDAKTLLAPGINFALVPQRIQPEYYARFTLDPPRFDVTTRMPKLALDGKTTKVTGILDGDARRQFAAIWEFLVNRGP